MQEAEEMQVKSRSVMSYDCRLWMIASPICLWRHCSLTMTKGGKCMTLFFNSAFSSFYNPGYVFWKHLGE